MWQAMRIETALHGKTYPTHAYNAVSTQYQDLQWISSEGSSKIEEVSKKSLQQKTIQADQECYKEMICLGSVIGLLAAIAACVCFFLYLALGDFFLFVMALSCLALLVIGGGVALMGTYKSSRCDQRLEELDRNGPIEDAEPNPPSPSINMSAEVML